MIELHGLTEHQCELLDIIWSMDSMTGVEAWVDTLSERDQQECRGLIELLAVEVLDQQIRLAVKFPEATKIIKHIQTL